jgi:arsenate reductase (thioredoxin)
MSDVSSVPLELRPMLRGASVRLAEEFEGTFGAETIERFLSTSYDQFAGRATVGSFLPLMAERFARQRLKALARVEGRAGDGVPVVLFLCVHNAGRSQMALGWFNHLAGDRAVAWSGGSEPGAEVNPAAIAAMAEVGIDISLEFPKPWTEGIVQAADVVVTMGCGDACPLFPGRRYEDWTLDDPFGKTVEAVRPVRDEIERRVRELLVGLGVPSAQLTGDEPAIDRQTVEEAVREHYAAAARTVTAGSAGADECGIGATCYDAGQLADLPDAAVAASIGCANPVAVADLVAGEVVLDLGSGGGIDVLLSARRVGPAGKAYGLDMTEEMLELARANQAKAGADNVEFLRGHMEDIPLPDSSVDVVLSNCVIALAVDKGAVFAEAHRVLRPGGRLAIADVVAEGVRPAQPADAATWVDCVSGALSEGEYREALDVAGFVNTTIERSHAVRDGLISVIVKATRPAAAT